MPVERVYAAAICRDEECVGHSLCCFFDVRSTMERKARRRFETRLAIARFLYPSKRKLTFNRAGYSGA